VSRRPPRFTRGEADQSDGAASAALERSNTQGKKRIKQIGNVTIPPQAFMVILDQGD